MLAPRDRGAAWFLSDVWNGRAAQLTLKGKVVR